MSARGGNLTHTTVPVPATTDPLPSGGEILLDLHHFRSPDQERAPTDRSKRGGRDCFPNSFVGRPVNWLHLADYRGLEGFIRKMGRLGRILASATGTTLWQRTNAVDPRAEEARIGGPGSGLGLHRSEGVQRQGASDLRPRGPGREAGERTASMR